MANAYNVLVVDDEPPIRRFLRASLSAAGHRVVTADDAAGALAAVTAEKPDLIILDLGLPDRSGLRSSPRSASTRRCRSLCCRRAATNARRSRRSISARMIILPSLSAWPS